MNQSVPMDSDSYSVSVSPDRPRREGYSFKGWSMSRGGEVMPDDVINLDRDIVLYAVWEAVDLPQTGDSSSMGLWLTLMLGSLLSLACIALLRRKAA